MLLRPVVEKFSCASALLRAGDVGGGDLIRSDTSQTIDCANRIARPNAIVEDN
jgi:hypothetical protein